MIQISVSNIYLFCFSREINLNNIHSFMNDLDDQGLLVLHIPSDSIFFFHPTKQYTRKLYLLDQFHSYQDP